ncbi:hypothetical protein MJO28_009061 [Puccinia striiformis f. sp. tritici]|uniref:Peptidyl-prolyl cis-trans isomerase n=4 Tax=Puccinia striiformis TaxID=27350 RepID=A0A0L0W5D7_9BASI|nr:hypothetical protein Pst134EA_017995 [Puccinia striiformis f. sp. tritici]KAI9626087.1 hypothetical protein KEM48_010596 [Puccinia striiformis f. sp. tritici PST-130]KNF06733.1 hypothetical protein PSTG_00049 [Puccinia striiformis f. sp. tritici PST-78]POW07062.1 hypothetical protein PSTT_08524 [Puccinia striiformis]KAH9451430.1 hypothetical protein Pst134EB_018899 [Puccinia striiformis f. sp. tritici]KAH9461710.1 hypothetical protein Pst134EA_017995 [Puccinia striiformis f. sp. tritici]
MAQHSARQTAVILETSMGVIQLELYWDHAPRTCHNFSELANRGYYNGTVIHRVVADFMAQGGDPTGTGRGGRSIYGDKFEDEIHPELRFTGAGILAMANSGPNSNTSQFFLTLAPTPHLDKKHTIFGRVHEGLKVLERIGAVNVDSEDRPREPVKILKARVVDKHA